MINRCGKCDNCKSVERTRSLVLQCLSRVKVVRTSRGPIQTTGGFGNNEDVRLLWNRELADHPCTEVTI
jgi:hypothetical protein